MAGKSEKEKFLRAAVKTGLRMQQRAAGRAAPDQATSDPLDSEGVATLQRIKASLRRRQSNSQ